MESLQTFTYIYEKYVKPVATRVKSTVVGCSAFYVSLSYMTCEVMMACNSYILCSSHSTSEKRDPHFYFKFQFLKICLVPLSPQPFPVEEPPVGTSLFHFEAITLHHAYSISFMLHKGGPPHEVVAPLAFTLPSRELLPFLAMLAPSLPSRKLILFLKVLIQSLPSSEPIPFLESIYPSSLSRS